MGRENHDARVHCGALLVQLKNEFCDTTEVAASASNSPEEIAVLRF